MQIFRIVGVLCCLALCGCVWQLSSYVPPPPPSPVIQAKDYVVPWPDVSWDKPPIDVRFVFPENAQPFSDAVHVRLAQRNYLRPVGKFDKANFIVTVSKFMLDYGHGNVDKEVLYYRPSINAELMQFDRIHFSFVIKLDAWIVIKSNNKIIFEGIFEGKIPDGQIYCTNFGEITRFPRVAETIYLWYGVKKMCLPRSEVTLHSIVRDKMAEIFAGDMEELIIGLMNL